MSCMELTDIATFATPTSVVKFLLLGRSGSLPRCARILSGIKEGCWQTNQSILMDEVVAQSKEPFINYLNLFLAASFFDIILPLYNPAFSCNGIYL